MAETHTLVIKLNEGAGFGEKPKVFLNDKEVGKVSIYKELSLSVSEGNYTLYLKGMAGGGRIANIEVEEAETFKECVFGVNIMSMSERYFLENIYSNKPISVSETVVAQSAESLCEEVNAPVVMENRKKSKSKFPAIILAIIAVVAGITLYSNLSSNDKMNGVYYSSTNIQYLIFSKDGVVKEATASLDGTHLVVYGTGEYKVDGERIIVYMNDLRPDKAMDVYKYNKSTDILTKSKSGAEYIRVE